ncbi:zinc ABC transporter substrate-binding protein [Limimonas halophila]|uniref:zinc ABC transporter substrate-binding protein n=1 Tax=Limimonas halophila TaxID=1082479 RepID=UPI001FE1D8C9|nr:zinc ABC transporter substrate-binding protein [Limimonas halophila]
MASVKPVHSLVASVMDGVATPELLVSGGQSPHTHSLAPSDAAALSRADLVVWVGPALEAFLTRPMANLVDADARLRLSEADGVRLLETRTSGVWDGGHGHDHSGDGGGHAHGEGKRPPADRTDPHIWLDPANAKAVVRAVAQRLQALEPANADAYAANAAATRKRIDAVDAEVRERIAPVRDVPYAVFHDAYHYFERRYRLNAVGSITLSPERRPSARRLQAIRETVGERGAACIFREPQFAPQLVRTVAEGTDVRVGVLDPLGAAIAPGPDLYPKLMRGLATSLRRCLGGKAAD